jgi:hypothetical protein
VHELAIDSSYRWLQRKMNCQWYLSQGHFYFNEGFTVVRKLTLGCWLLVDNAGWLALIAARSNVSVQPAVAVHI